MERSFLEINAKGGEILGENVREERLICGFKGIKERHIRFFNFMAWCVQGKFKLMLLIRTVYASVMFMPLMYCLFSLTATVR